MKTAKLEIRRAKPARAPAIEPDTAGDGRVAAALALLTVASFVLFAVRGGSVGYWYDELWSVDAVGGSFARMLERVAADVHPPGYHLLLWGWVRIFGSTELATHALSALCMAAVAPFVYGLGRRLAMSREAALGAAAFAGFGYASINYALETRPYALLVLLTTAALWSVAGEFTRRRFAFAFAVGTLGLYSHYGILFTAVPGVAWLALRRREWRWLLLPAAWGIAFLPWAARIVSQAARFKQMGWLQPPTANDFFRELGFFVGLPYGKWVFGAVAVAAGVVAIRRRKPGDLWLLVFPSVFGGLFVVSLVLQPLFHQRYVLPLIPWFALTLGYLIDQTGRRERRAVGAALLGAVALFSAHYFFVIKAEDWRAPARFVEERRAGATVVTTESSAFFRHYFPGIVVLPEGAAAPARQWLAAHAGREYWLVQARNFKATPATNALADGSEILEINEFPGTRALKLAVPPAR